MVYCQEEFLHDPSTLPHEKNIRELQKFLNERYILLEEKQSISEHEYVFLGRALGYIFSFKKKTC